MRVKKLQKDKLAATKGISQILGKIFWVSRSIKKKNILDQVTLSGAN